MAGFFESMKRMIEGKPVFDANDDNKGWIGKNGQPQEASADPSAPVQSQPVEPKSSIIKGNANTFPKVYVKRTRTQLSGSNQIVYVSIYNASQVEIELEELEIMGNSKQLGSHLRPGEEREFMVYNGPRKTSESHREAHLNYKEDETNDYFQSIHDVEYQFEQGDKTYSVEELHLRLPIRDIYG